MKESNRANLTQYSKWLALAGGALVIITGLAALCTADKWSGNSLDADSNGWLTAYIWFMGLVLTLTGPFAVWSARVVAVNSWLANRLQLVAGVMGFLVAYQVRPFYWVLVGPVLLIISGVLSGRAFHREVAVVLKNLKSGAGIYHNWYYGLITLEYPGEERGDPLDPAIFKYLRAGRWLRKQPDYPDDSGVDYYRASGKL